MTAEESLIVRRVRERFPDHEFREETSAKAGLLFWSLFMDGVKVLHLTRRAHLWLEVFETESVIEAIFKVVQTTLDRAEVTKSILGENDLWPEAIEHD